MALMALPENATESGGGAEPEKMESEFEFHMKVETKEPQRTAKEKGRKATMAQNIGKRLSR